MFRRLFILAVCAAAWLGIPQPGRSQGTIEYHQPAVPIVLRTDGFTQYYPFDIDGNGTSDLMFAYWFQAVGVRYENGARAFSFVNPPPDFYADPLPLPAGFIIGPNSGTGQLQWFAGYPPPYNFNTLVYVVNTGTSGAFAGQRGYMGLEFQRDGATHYGWMLLQVDSFAAGASIESWAWETRPGAGIIAGSGMPEPSTWSLFFVGLLSLAFFTRKFRAT